MHLSADLEKNGGKKCSTGLRCILQNSYFRMFATNFFNKYLTDKKQRPPQKVSKNVIERILKPSLTGFKPIMILLDWKQLKWSKRFI